MNSALLTNSFADFVQEQGENIRISCDSDDDSNEDKNEDEDYVERMLKNIIVMKLPSQKIIGVAVTNKTSVQGTQGDSESGRAKKKRKHGSGGMIWTNPGDHRQYRISPYMSQWYNYYIAHPPVDDERFLKRFRRRFRVPFAYFNELKTELEATDDFRQWRHGSQNCFGARAAPISLLLLAVLRYLGRAWTLDDLSESTCISQEVIRAFLHKFLHFGSTVLYKRYVLTPSCAEDARKHMAEYSDAGFPGAVGSTDATHIILERVPNKHRQSHLGFKSTHTARAYNITVNHRRRILATTSGYPARWNDKTLALFDPFMQGLHEGKILDDVIFHLYAYNEEGDVVKQPYRGGWLLVDNGYLARPTTVPPIKTSNSRAEIRFSSWLESLRKDVECTFGIIKGRWRILKTGIRIHGTDGPDKVFLTCCALHNKLLDVDGLDEEWEQGVPSIWADQYDNDLGDNDNEHDDDEDYMDDAAIPDALFRLRNPANERQYGIDATVSDDTDMPCQQQQNPSAVIERGLEHIQSVRKLSLHDFRQRLVTHFAIAFERNEVKWPRRFGGTTNEE